MNLAAVAPPNGVLALWNDCAPGQESFYENWYQTEHLVERLGIAGFHRGRRYEALDGKPRFFTYYETTTPDVLSSAAYIARLNDPTPATRQIMNGGFINMSRTICRCVARKGEMRGAVALTVKLSASVNGLNEAGLSEAPARLVQDAERVVRAEIWQAVTQPEHEPSAEEKLRGGDKKITACLFAETLRRDAAEKLREQLLSELGNSVEGIGIYGLLCERIGDGLA